MFEDVCIFLFAADYFQCFFFFPFTENVPALKQQLELDMEQQTSSKLGKEYIKAVYCHPAYLTYIQSIS